MVQKKIRLGKYLFYHSEWNLTASNSVLTARLDWHTFRPVSCTMLYSKLYILIELNLKALDFISIDRQKLDLSKEAYLWYRKFYIFRETTQFYEHKKCPSYLEASIQNWIQGSLLTVSYVLQACKVGIDLKDCYVGEEAQTYRGMLNIKYPIEYGIVTNWDDMESVWYHTFHNELKVSPEGRNIFLTETCHNPHENSEKTIEIMFEKFKASGAHLAYQAPLAMFGTGRTDGVVLDCGHGITQAMPISDGKIILDSAMLCNLAGGYINSYLAHLLSLDGHSVTTAADKEDIIKIKHDLCYVAEDYKSESEKASSSKTLEKDFKPPSGAAITIGSELFKSTECLFQPSLLGIDGVLTSVHETLFYSIRACPRDKHAMLFKNIVLSGGTTLLKGFKERIQKELRALAPPGTAVKVVAAPDRNLLVWIGGAIVASLSTFDAYWIKKSDYDEYGPAIVHDFRYQWGS